MRKETVLEVVDSFPDEIDIDALLNRLYVMEQIEQGERDIDAGRFVTQEEAEQRMRQWLE